MPRLVVGRAKGGSSLALEFTFTHLLAIAAGLFIAGIGAFVVRAKPRSRLHQTFFVLAIADGASTIAFELRNMGGSPSFTVWSMQWYWGAYLVYLAALIVFGFVFPTSLRGRSGRRVTYVVGIALGLVLSIQYVFAPTAFWRSSSSGGVISFSYTDLGRIVQIAFILAPAVVMLKLIYELARRRSESRRQQAVYVLGGLMLGYAVYDATGALDLLPGGPSAPLVASRPLITIAHVAEVVAIVGMFVGGIIAWTLLDGMPRARRFLAACLASVAALALLSRVTAVGSDVAQILALLVYPSFLAYAILRYEILDISRHLRRVAAVSVALTALGAVYILFEALLQQALQDQLQSSVGSTTLAIVIAATITAILGIPVARIAQRVAKRIAPEPTDDAQEIRKVEIYRHALEGALADGVITAAESEMLRRLREALGITSSAHDEIMRELGGPAPA